MFNQSFIVLLAQCCQVSPIVVVCYNFNAKTNNTLSGVFNATCRRLCETNTRIRAITFTYRFGIRNSTVTCKNFIERSINSPKATRLNRLYVVFMKWQHHLLLYVVIIVLSFQGNVLLETRRTSEVGVWRSFLRSWANTGIDIEMYRIHAVKRRCKFILRHIVLLIVRNVESLTCVSRWRLEFPWFLRLFPVALGTFRAKIRSATRKRNKLMADIIIGNYQ